MNSGRGVYLEGADFGYNNSSTPIYPMFGCSYLGDGNAIGNVMNVIGQAGSITQGKNYDYLYQQGPDSYVDYIGANGGTIIYRSQENNGRAVSYNGTSGNYRSIHSAFIFGALRNGANTKLQLMQTYMTYLLSYLGTEEHKSEALANIAVYPNPGRVINISFTLNNPARSSIKLYNIAGQEVRNLVNAQMAPGAHNIVFDGLDDNGKHLSSGTYILRIKQDEVQISKPIVLIN